MEDWAEIRRLYRSERLSQSAIARQLSLSRNTVAKALRSDGPPQYERAPVTTSARAAVEPAVRALLVRYPTVPASEYSGSIVVPVFPGGNRRRRVSAALLSGRAPPAASSPSQAAGSVTSESRAESATRVGGGLRVPSRSPGLPAGLGGLLPTRTMR